MYGLWLQGKVGVSEGSMTSSVESRENLIEKLVKVKWFIDQKLN